MAKGIDPNFGIPYDTDGDIRLHLVMGRGYGRARLTLPAEWSFDEAVAAFDTWAQDEAEAALTGPTK